MFDKILAKNCLKLPLVTTPLTTPLLKRIELLCYVRIFIVIRSQDVSRIFYLVIAYMSIYVGRDGYVSMSHQLLCRPDVDSGPLEVRAVSMPKIVRNEVRSQSERRHELIAVNLYSHGDIHVTLQT